MWVLETIANNWPDGDVPDNLARVNQDRPENLTTGEREQEVELSNFNIVAATRGDRQREARGTEFWYTVYQTVDVRVEAAHDSVYGHVSDDDEYLLLLNKIQRAIDDARCYPTIAGKTFGEVAYSEAMIQNETQGLGNHRDHYRTDFEVRLRGKQER